MPIIAKSIPVLTSNYAYLLASNTGLAVIDPGEARPVLDVLGQHDLAISHVLLTHHDMDHTGGAVEVARHFDAPIVGPKDPRMPMVDEYVGEGDTIAVGEASIDVWHTPGHASDHMVFMAPGHLWCGDVIFGAGCGRLRDGTAPELFASLRRLSQLPRETLVYVGHEYTLRNIAFALTIEPENEELKAREAISKLIAERGQYTTPTTIGLELDTNPFLRCDVPDIQQRVGLTDPLEVFTALRALRDQW